MSPIKLSIKIINLWCLDKGLYGITPPFMIGAIRLNTSFNNYSIENYINDFSSSKEVLKVSYCSDIDEFIFGVFKNEDGPKKYYKCFGNIYVANSSVLNKVNNLNNLIDFLESKYSDKISNQLFSKDYYSNEWSEFTDNDILMFNQILK